MFLIIESEFSLLNPRFGLYVKCWNNHFAVLRVAEIGYQRTVSYKIVNLLLVCMSDYANNVLCTPTILNKA